MRVAGLLERAHQAPRPPGIVTGGNPLGQERSISGYQTDAHGEVTDGQLSVDATAKALTAAKKLGPVTVLWLTAQRWKRARFSIAHWQRSTQLIMNSAGKY